jgi:hypothetical protein
MQVLAMILLALVASTEPTTAQLTQRRPGVTDIEFKTTTPGQLSDVEIQIPDVASGRSQKRAVTDLMVRLGRSNDNVSAALNLPNGAPVDRDDGLFRAQVYVVSGGRLLADTEARCDRWVGDVTICSVPCEGGMFGLRRPAGAATSAVTVLIGRLPRGAQEGSKPGFSLSGCGDPAAPDLVLAPAGARATVEVVLKAR